MDSVLTRCGYRCDLCLAYRPSIEADPGSARVLSDGWHRYFGFRIPPEEIACDGCLSEDGHRIDATCAVRACVIAHAVENCAACPDFEQGSTGQPGDLCATLTTRDVTRAEVEARLGAVVSEEDYLRFIQPYENMARLKADDRDLRDRASFASSAYAESHHHTALARGARRTPGESRLAAQPCPRDGVK
jgi:hypothetical protein